MFVLHMSAEMASTCRVLLLGEMRPRRALIHACGSLKTTGRGMPADGLLLRVLILYDDHPQRAVVYDYVPRNRIGRDISL